MTLSPIVILIRVISTVTLNSFEGTNVPFHYVIQQPTLWSNVNRYE